MGAFLHFKQHPLAFLRHAVASFNHLPCTMRYLLLLLTTIWAFGLSAQEICNNSIDDDADGLIDLNDTTDCFCANTSVPLEGILPNPSFEDFDCQPVSYSQLDCADTWSQGTYSTADYFLNPSYMPAWIEQPLPGGGIACVGGYFCPDYMEYVGGCLLAPMVSDSSYTLKMSVAGFIADNFLSSITGQDLSPVNITIYGFATCPSFPTNVSLCPGTEGWTELGHATYDPSVSWSEITISFVPPFDVQAILIGSPCTLPPDYPSVANQFLAYFLVDELSLHTTGTVGPLITSEGSWCNGDLVLTAHADSTMTGYQWYQGGIAIPGASDTVLAVSALALDSGNYVFQVLSDTSCALSNFHVNTQIEPTPYIALTVDGLWCPVPGTYQWFLNNTLIPGATDDYYLPLENGVYTVMVTNDPGCSTLSYAFDWINTAIATSPAEWIILTFSQEDATLQVRGAQGRSLLTVSDASGRVIKSMEFTGPDHRYSMASAARGVYVARINDRTIRFIR